jgi:hypothetical protein
MKHLLVALKLVVFSSHLFAAEEESSSESSLLYFELGEISAPLSFYTENWNPKEKLPLKLPGIRVEEKDLVVDLDEAIRKSREEQDLLRSQNSWLSDSNLWIPPIESKEEFYEEIGD